MAHITLEDLHIMADTGLASLARDLMSNLVRDPNEPTDEEGDAMCTILTLIIGKIYTYLYAGLNDQKHRDNLRGAIIALFERTEIALSTTQRPSGPTPPGASAGP